MNTPVRPYRPYGHAFRFAGALDIAALPLKLFYREPLITDEQNRSFIDNTGYKR